MKTIDELNAKLLNATNLAEKIVIRIEMIELNRRSKIQECSIRHLSDLLDRVHSERNSFRYSAV